MPELLNAKNVALLRGEILIIELSDGSTIQVTLAQVLSLNPKVIATAQIDAD